jgi:hypothetical protein
VKRPKVTWAAALRADSIEAAQICHWIISELPRDWKLWVRKYQWHGRRFAGWVFIRAWILSKRIRWSFNVKPSILWCISKFQNIHCLWVIDMSDLMNPTPHFSTDFHGDHCWRSIRITSNQRMAMHPSMKLSHPS